MSHHIPPFFRKTICIGIMFSVLLAYFTSLPPAYSYGTSTDNLGWKFQAVDGSSRFRYNYSALNHSQSGVPNFITSTRFGLEIRVNASSSVAVQGTKQTLFQVGALYNTTGFRCEDTTSDCMSMNITRYADGLLYLEYNIRSVAGQCGSGRTILNWSDRQFHVVGLFYNSSIPRSTVVIDGSVVSSSNSACSASLSVGQVFMRDFNGTASGSPYSITLDYLRFYYPNNGTNIVFDNFASTPPHKWRADPDYSGYTVTLENLSTGGTQGTDISLIAQDTNNNTRYQYANGEDFYLNALLFVPGSGPISGEDIRFQQLINNIWNDIATSRTDSNGEARYHTVIVDQAIGNTLRFRSLYDGSSFYTSSTSNNITITIVSFSQIPNIIPTSLTLEPVRRVVNVDEFGVRESLEVNYEYGLFQNWRLRAYLYRADGAFCPCPELEGKQLKFYIKKNNVGQYFNFANTTTDINGLALTPWFSFDQTWSGRSSIQVRFDGTYQFAPSNSTNIIIAINSGTMRLTLNVNPQLVNIGSSTKAFGYLTRNSTLTGANLTVAIPNENVRIWINSTTTPFRLLGTISTDVNGYYEIEFLVPSSVGTYFLRANSTVPLYNANVSSPVRQFTVRSIAADQEPSLNPDSPDIKAVFLMPLDTCADRAFCGYLFWIFLEIAGIILLGIFPLVVLNNKGKEINPTIVGLWLSMIFLTIFGFGWILGWLPVWSPILILLPTALILVGYLTQRRSNGE